MKFGAFDKFRKEANKFSVSDLPLTSKISAPTELILLILGVFIQICRSIQLQLKSEKCQALYAFIICLFNEEESCSL